MDGAMNWNGAHGPRCCSAERKSLQSRLLARGRSGFELSLELGQA